MLIEEEGKGEQHFSFTLVDKPSFTYINTKDVSQKLTQWGLLDNMVLSKFRFDIAFSPLYVQKFVYDFFNSTAVRSAMGMMLSTLSPAVTKIDYKVLSTKITSMDFFDCLEKNDIVKAGYIRKDFEDTFQEISICDKLRQALLIEESESYLAFTESDRNEFIYKLFSNIVIGGGMCQYEDMIEPYLNITKMMYKDLISVAKSESGDLLIQSTVVEIKDIDKANIYKTKDHPQNFLYLIIDHSQRSVILFYHKWVGYWG